MKAYHEIPADARGNVLDNGLMRSTRGEKGDDELIVRTDEFLEARLPKRLRESGVSRERAVYAYYCHQDHVVDITNGELVPIQLFVSRSEGIVLELEIDAGACYVSNLDTFDALKSSLRDGATSEKLAESYWAKLVRLDNYEHGIFRRPEVIITYDVSPEFISALN